MVIYLNHAGTSWPKPAPVQAAVSSAMRARVDTWASSFATAHARIAGAFGIADPTRLLLTPGCTSALSVGVSDLPWLPGDRVLCSAFEHHALHRPLQLLEQRGVDLEVIPPAGAAPLDLEVLEATLRRGGVRLVALSAASNVTGALLPVREVVALAHAAGAQVLLDAAQVAGWMPLDVIELGVDLMAFAGHKGLQAPWGIGGLYVAEHVLMTSPLAVCALPEPGEAVTDCAPMPGYCDTGSVDRLALAGLVAGLDWLDAPEQADRLSRGREVIAELAEAMSGVAGVSMYGPRPPEARLPTLALTLEGMSPGKWAGELEARGVIAASGLQCAPLAHESLGTAPEGVLRLSVGPGVEGVDVGAVCEALRGAIG